MKKYVDISRLKEKYAEMFDIGEHIVVESKIDGANASFTYDAETDCIAAFSRNQRTFGLHGFWEWTQKLPLELIREVTEDGRYIIFGEWLIKHSVSYPETAYNKFYMFDVYDTQEECYIPYRDAWVILGKIFFALKETETEINFVPVLYNGEFKSWELLMELMSLKTLGGQPCEEGIVIKTQDRLKDKENSKRPKYIKIVNEKFSEVHHDNKKPIDPETLKKREQAKEQARTIVTERRVEKILQKCIDEGELRPDWDETDMGWIAKNIIKKVYDDTCKEEPEIVSQIENFGKMCGSITMEHIRNFLNKQ